MDKTIYVAIEGEASNWEEAIYLSGQALQTAGVVDDSFSKACIEREKEYPTGLPSDIPVAIPHAMSDRINENAICFLRLHKTVRFKRMDDFEEYINTRIIFNLAIKDANKHIQILQKLMKLIMNEKAMKQCLNMEIKDVSKFIEQELENKT